MNMKEHILSAMREQVARWEALLAGLSSEQIATPLSPSEWAIKDELAHLWAWQQRSIARVRAALDDREPVFPEWAPGVDPEEFSTTDITNAWLYAAYRDQPWNEVYRNWHEGYLHLISLAEQVSERDLLDSGRYAWLGGHPLVFILLATYDHHQEHYDMLKAWLAC